MIRRVWLPVLLLLLALGLAAGHNDAAVWVALRQAEVHVAQGDFPAAEGSYRVALQAAPDDPYPALRLAELYQTWGKPQQALAALAEARQRGLPEADYVPRQLQLLAQAEDWETLLATAQEHDDPQTLALVTQAYLHLGDCASAEATAARWREIAPEEQDAQDIWRTLHAPPDALATGLKLIRQQRWPLAYCVLQRATTAEPTSAVAHAWYGESAARLGLTDTAQEQFQLATELAPEAPLGWLLWGTDALRRTDWETARVALLRAQRLDPANPAPCLALAEVKAGQGHYNEVNTWIDAALERSPADPAIWKAVARFYLERNLRLPPYPLKAAQGAVQLAPQDAEAHTLLGWAYLLNGDLEAARTALDDALALAPDDAKARALRDTLP